jgi:hypothetical protein
MASLGAGRLWRSATLYGKLGTEIAGKGVKKVGKCVYVIQTPEQKRGKCVAALYINECSKTGKPS